MPNSFVPFFRLAAILKILFKHRLDALLDELTLPLWLRCLLFFPGLLPKPKKPRGQRLREACEDLGPIFIKFGQLLSTRPDVVAADIVNELDRLQDDVPPFDNNEFRRIVEQALGDSVENLFVNFEAQPLASASVAQVHGAILKGEDDNEKEVVVKVIRPGIEKTIAKDIALMQWLAAIVEGASKDGKRLRPKEVVEEYRHTIFNELNLQREAANASHLRRNFSQSSLLYVPEVYWPYVRHNVMVMERVHGVPVTNVEELKKREANLKVLAERGVEIFFTQVFEHNFFHADMHPGNIFVDCTQAQAPSYIAVDMAIVTSLNQEDQYYLARNILAMFRRDYRQVAELHVSSGWVGPNTDINEFESAIRSVCEPIFEKPLKEISFGHVLVNLFQTAQRFDMPIQPQLVLLQKTLLNIEGLGRQLYPDLDLWTTAHPFLERWLKERFKPKTLVQQLKRYGPDWMEKFPQVPQLVFKGLQQMNELETISQQWQQAQVIQAKKRRRRQWWGAAAILCGTVIAWPALGENLSQLPSASLALLALGAFLWLMG